MKKSVQHEKRCTIDEMRKLLDEKLGQASHISDSSIKTAKNFMNALYLNEDCSDIPLDISVAGDSESDSQDDQSTSQKDKFSDEIYLGWGTGGCIIEGNSMAVAGYEMATDSKPPKAVDIVCQDAEGDEEEFLAAVQCAHQMMIEFEPKRREQLNRKHQEHQMSTTRWIPVRNGFPTK